MCPSLFLWLEGFVPYFKNHPQKSGIYSPTVLLLKCFVIHNEVSNTPGAGLCVWHKIQSTGSRLRKEARCSTAPLLSGRVSCAGVVSRLSRAGASWASSGAVTASPSVLFFSRGSRSFLALHFRIKFGIGLSSYTHTQTHTCWDIFETALNR